MIQPKQPKRAWQRRLAQLNACNRRARRNAARVLAWLDAHCAHACKFCEDAQS